MPPQTTSNTNNSVRAQYESDYMEAAVQQRVYDQFAGPIGSDMSEIKKGSSVTVPFLSSLAPSSQLISETTDLTPTNFTDATVTVTPTSRGNAVLVSEKLLNTNYTSFNADYYGKVGENMMLSVDIMAMTAAVTGGLSKSPTTRSSLDAGTTTHRMQKSMFATASVMLSAMKVPMMVTPRGRRWMCLMHPFAYTDLMQDAVILAVGEYQNQNMILNYELGEVNGFSVIVSPWAKAFWGAGNANASAISTTLTTLQSPLDLTINVAANTNMVAGMRMMIGTVETANTLYSTNESVIIQTVASNVITIIGEGENGGLRYPHLIGESVKNTDSVYPAIFGGPESLGKVYDTSVGEFGQLVGPTKSGLVEQFTTLGWKWYGGYGIVAQNRILRSEVSSSVEA